MNEPKPSDVWLEAFERQATSKLITRCRHHARWCLEEYRLDRGPHYHLEVVQNALGDIFEGRIAWNPTRCSLEDQVCDVIKYRVRDEKRSAAGRRLHVALDRPVNDETMVDDGRSRRIARDVEAAMSVVADPESELARKQERELGARIGDELAKLAQGDQAVEALLVCIRAGVSALQEVLEETGMTADELHNARRRLRRLTGRLSEELRAKATSLL